MKNLISLGITALVMCVVMSHQTPTPPQNPSAPLPQDTLLNVKGKTALFIGDSHTANFKNGWQRRLSDSVGFVCKNAAVSGKTTYFMLDMAVYKLSDNINWCFVYGGANDMYTHTISPQEAVDNISAIARLCQRKGIRCVVITGFDPIQCTRTDNPYYAKRYAAFQHILLTQGVPGATVVDTRVVALKDCWDPLCHMAPSGHAKVAKRVQSALHLASQSL